MGTNLVDEYLDASRKTESMKPHWKNGFTQARISYDGDLIILPSDDATGTLMSSSLIKRDSVLDFAKWILSVYGDRQ